MAEEAWRDPASVHPSLCTLCRRFAVAIPARNHPVDYLADLFASSMMAIALNVARVQPLTSEAVAKDCTPPWPNGSCQAFPTPAYTNALRRG